MASPNSSLLQNLRRHYVQLSSAEWDFIFMALLLAGESLLGAVIIYKVPYTEIDWIAYMQEVDFWLDGEYDYRKIYGNTGPLVYPAGFLYLFGVLQRLSNREIINAQFIFLVFYILTQAFVMMIYTMVLRELRSSKKFNTDYDKFSVDTINQSHQVWSFRLAMACLCLSKRFHSIFLLRLFNDGPTMLIAYISFWCFMRQKWNLGCFLFSVAVSIKMNVLLFAPGLLFLLLQVCPLMTIPRLAICGLTQLILGAPFLLRHPISYLRKAFELDRQFFFKWTVNLRFLPEQVFLSKQTAVVLLALHLTLLGIFLYRLYKSGRSIKSPEHILSTLLISNFIGICCARTLHYQFYCWYFSSLPFLLWRQTGYPFLFRLVLLGAVEFAFLTFPATQISSLVLQAAHWAILLPCVFGTRQGAYRLKGD